jgi:hypothetical protein
MDIERVVQELKLTFLYLNSVFRVFEQKYSYDEFRTRGSREEFHSEIKSALNLAKTESKKQGFDLMYAKIVSWYIFYKKQRAKKLKNALRAVISNSSEQDFDDLDNAILIFDEQPN